MRESLFKKNSPTLQIFYGQFYTTKQHFIDYQENDGNASLIGQDFDIDLGGRTRYNDEDDNADDPLFSWVSDDLIGTYKIKN